LPVLTESAVRESDEHSSSTSDEQLSLRLGSHAYHSLDESYPDTSSVTALHSGDDSSSGIATAAATASRDSVDHDIGNALLLHSNSNKNSSSRNSSSSSTGQHQR
jgi:hypothetical protein